MFPLVGEAATAAVFLLLVIRSENTNVMGKQINCEGPN